MESTKSHNIGHNLRAYMYGQFILDNSVPFLNRLRWILRD